MNVAMDEEREEELRRGLNLEYFSIIWNTAEAIVGIFAGIMAGSVALLGFALDSVAESSSAGVLIWRLHAERRGARTAESAERLAIRMVAVAFFALAVYITGRAIYQLVLQIHPEQSWVGMGLAVVSALGMPFLAAAKRRSARALDSRSLQADSRQTMLCTYMSVLLLAGLAANSLFGMWWADPVAGLGIAALAVKEGWVLWTTEDLCCI